MTPEQELLRTLEHRVATHGEGVLSPQDLAELHRLRGTPEEVTTEEEPINEGDED